MKKNQFYVGLSALSLAVSLNVISISDALATTGCFASGNQVNCYDNSDHLLQSFTNPEGKPTSNNGNGTANIGGTEYSYDPATNSVTAKNFYSKTTTTYNSSGQKVQQTTQDRFSPNSSTTTYNSNGTTASDSSTQPNSNGGVTTTTRTYYANGTNATYSQTKTNSSGVTTYSTETTYNSNGQPTYSTTTNRNSSGQVTSSSEYSYSNGKATSGSSTSYDANGNAKTTDYAYNSSGYQTGSTTTYTDSHGNALTGTWVSDNTTYNVSNGTLTGYTYAYSSTCYTSGPNGCQSGSRVENYNANGGLIDRVTTDMNGNQAVYANGQTTYLDKDGNPLSGTYTNGRYAYDYENGVRTGYSYADSYSITEYDAQNRPTGYTNCSSRVTNNHECNNVYSTREYERNERGDIISETYEDRYGYGAVYEYERDEQGRLISQTYENTDGYGYAYGYERDEQGRLISETYDNTYGDGYLSEYDESGRMTDYVSYNSNGDIWGYSNVYDSNGNHIGYENFGGTRDENGLLYLSGIGVNGERIGYIKDKNGNLLAKSICQNNYSGQSDNAYAEGNCVTEFYDSEGRVMSEYDQSANPLAAYLYDGDIVAEYDDQCMVKNLYDSDGNLLPAAIGDNLYNEKRKKRYTPSEASQIVKNSNDNSLILYYK